MEAIASNISMLEFLKNGQLTGLVRGANSTHSQSWIDAIETENRSHKRKLEKLNGIELDSDAESISSLSCAVTDFPSAKRLVPLSVKLRQKSSSEEIVLGDITIPAAPKRVRKIGKKSIKIPKAIAS